MRECIGHCIWSHLPGNFADAPKELANAELTLRMQFNDVIILTVQTQDRPCNLDHAQVGCSQRGVPWKHMFFRYV